MQSKLKPTTTMTEKCSLNIQDYNVTLSTNEKLDLSLEFECTKSHDLYAYSEKSYNIIEFTRQFGTVMDAPLFYNFIKTAVKSNLLCPSKVTPDVLCVTFRLAPGLDTPESIVKNIPILLLKKDRNSKDELAMSLIEIIDDLTTIMSPLGCTLTKIPEICGRLEKLQLPTGSLREKILNAKMRLKNMVEPSLPAPMVQHCDFAKTKLGKRDIRGPGGPISLDNIMFQNCASINGYVIDSFSHNGTRPKSGTEQLILTPTVKNLTAKYITLTTHIHLVSFSSFNSNPDPKPYRGQKLTVSTKVCQIIPNGMLTLDSNYVLQGGDYSFLSTLPVGAIVFTIDGDVNDIEYVNTKLDTTYSVAVARITKLN